MSRRMFLPLLFLGFLFIGQATARADTIYDLNADWSNSANPNGPWTYREGSNALPSQASWLTADFPSGGQPAWAVAPSGQGHIPGWFQSSVTPTIAGGDQCCYDFLIGDVVVHSQDDGSGPGLGPANVIWTSPMTGTADILGSVWLARNIGRSNHFNLYFNSTLLASGDLFDGDAYDRANPLAFSALGLAVNSGDIIRLEVVRTSTSGEFTGVNLNIDFTPIPEPGTLLLLGSGLLGAAGYGRKKLFRKV